MEALQNFNIAVWIMAFIVFALTYLVKLPFKHFVTDKIQNEQTRKNINSLILLLPFIFGLLAQFIYSQYICHVAFNLEDFFVRGFIIGGQSIMMYGIIERFFKVKIENPYESGQGKEIADDIKDMVSDNKIDKNEIDDFISKL